jgi:hypothetical protein
VRTLRELGVDLPTIKRVLDRSARSQTAAPTATGRCWGS